MIAKIDLDDVGLPESPIYSNYPKHMWKAHRKVQTRPGAAQTPAGSREKAGVPRPPQAELPPAATKPPVAA